MSIDRVMDKDIVHIYTMEYYSAIKKNEIMPLTASWMDLEIIILSKVSQKEKDKYHMIITYIWNLNYGTNGVPLWPSGLRIWCSLCLAWV